MSRRAPKFSTRTAEEDASRLDPSDLANPPHDDSGKLSSWWPGLTFQFPRKSERHRSLPVNFLPGISRWRGRDQNVDEQGEPEDDHRSNMALTPGPLRESSLKDKTGHKSHHVDHHHRKLGTYSGVFVPTTLNVLSILMFLRFSFILGQAGVLGILGELHVAHNPLTDC